MDIIDMTSRPINIAINPIEKIKNAYNGGDPVMDYHGPVLKTKLLDPKCMPVREHLTDAGLDLKIRESCWIPSLGKSEKPIGTGICVEIPAMYMGMVVPRSGISIDRVFGLTNTLGIIDAPYRGEIKLSIHNTGNSDLTLSKYETIAQLIILPILTPRVEVVDELTPSDRGDGGFGHTNARKS